MKVIIIIGICVGVATLIFYCACNLSGKVTEQEEKRHKREEEYRKNIAH